MANLDAAQLVTFKADILGNTDPLVIQGLSDGNHGAIANWYNLPATPDYWVLRNNVGTEEIRDAIDAQDVVNITAADLDRVLALINLRSDRGFSGANPSDVSAWDDVFSAATGDNSQQAIAALWTRTCTNVEKVFSLATASGVDAANADTTSFQGTIASGDVTAALNS